jgi:inner membrane protein
VRGETHLVAGVAAGMILARSQGIDPPAALGMAGAAGVAALVPDWLQINAPTLNRTIKGAFGHRGFTHWLLTVGVIYLVARDYVPLLAPGIAAGWLSHIVLDAFNRPGVPAFWPLPWRLRLAALRTGGRIDRVMTWLAGAVVLWGAVSVIL